MNYFRFISKLKGLIINNVSIVPGMTTCRKKPNVRRYETFDKRLWHVLHVSTFDELKKVVCEFVTKTKKKFRQNMSCQLLRQDVLETGKIKYYIQKCVEILLQKQPFFNIHT